MYMIYIYIYIYIYMYAARRLAAMADYVEQASRDAVQM